MKFQPDQLVAVKRVLPSKVITEVHYYVIIGKNKDYRVDTQYYSYAIVM